MHVRAAKKLSKPAWAYAMTYLVTTFMMLARTSQINTVWHAKASKQAE